MQVRLLNQGDTGLIVEFGDRLDRATLKRVSCLDRRLQSEISSGRLDGVIEVVPTYRSLTIIYEPLRLPCRQLRDRLLPLLNDEQFVAENSVRQWCLPVCYDPEHGPDLDTVARARGLTTAEVVSLHASRSYCVYMIGFLPGFPYMGDLDPALQMPRRPDPRVRVPKGSVAITGLQTAIYPWVSPGGWQLIGRCPVPLFDPSKESPALLAQGDSVTFKAIEAPEFRETADDIAAGTLSPLSFLTSAEGTDD